MSGSSGDAFLISSIYFIPLGGKILIPLTFAENSNKLAMLDREEKSRAKPEINVTVDTSFGC